MIDLFGQFRFGDPRCQGVCKTNMHFHLEQTVSNYHLYDEQFMTNMWKQADTRAGKKSPPEKCTSACLELFRVYY